MTRREDIIELLRREEMTSQQLAHSFQTKKKAILSDLNHIRKTMRTKNWELVMKMPVCNQCGFIFSFDSIREPSKCPHCHSTWISPPTYRVIS